MGISKKASLRLMGILASWREEKRTNGSGGKAQRERRTAHQLRPAAGAFKFHLVELCFEEELGQGRWVACRQPSVLWNPPIQRTTRPLYHSL